MKAAQQALRVQKKLLYMFLTGYHVSWSFGTCSGTQLPVTQALQHTSILTLQQLQLRQMRKQEPLISVSLHQPLCSCRQGQLHQRMLRKERSHQQWQASSQQQWTATRAACVVGCDGFVAMRLSARRC
jgi:hypothetical protein